MSGKHQDQDFELNLASIIDCFTVLITYLLVSASFISLASLDVTVAAIASDAPAESEKPPALTVTVFLKQDFKIAIYTEGKERNTVIVPAKDGYFDYDSVTPHLEGIKERHATLDSAMVTADDKVPYSRVIGMIDTVRKTLPKVAMSAGFGSS